MIEWIDIRQDSGTEWFQPVSHSGGSTILVLVTYGKCVYWVEQEKIIVEKGDLLLIPPFTSFYGKSIPTVLHEKYVLRFISAAGAGELPILLSRKQVKARSGLYDYILDRIKTISMEIAEQTPYAEVRAQAVLLEIMALWNRELEERPIPAETLTHVERMKDYIKNHYREKVTKEELGESIAKTPNYAASLFSRVTGQTISEAVHAARVKAAVYMLAESLLTVGEISEFLGYRDLSYFLRIFKKTTGKPPSHYMKERPKT